MKDFFVGYQPLTPRLRAALLWSGLLAVSAAAAAATLLVLSQDEFEEGSFEFGQLREYEGWVAATPVPSLRVEGPSGVTRYLLVSQGKFGAPAEIVALDGEHVRLSGSLIHRDPVRMLELEPGSWSLHEQDGPAPDDSGQVMGEVELEGEIVDPKCFLGVMKPGRFKTHRGCAVRCLSGGIPPALYAQGPDGASSLYFLVSGRGQPIGQAVLDRVAEPVRLRGRLEVRDGLQFVTVDPRDIVRVL